MFEKISLKGRMIAIGMVSLIGLLILGSWAAFHTRSQIYEERRVMLKTLVDAAKTQVTYYQKQEKTGVLPTSEAKRLATEALRAMSFQGKNYFFMYTYDGITVLLPPSPEKEGQSRLEVKDANGVPLIRNLIEAGRSGGAFTKYDYPRPGETKALPKIGYAANIDGWNWIVGAGLYVDDIDEAFYRNLLMSGLAILVLGGAVFGLTFLIASSVLRSIGGELNHVMSIMQRVSSGDLSVEVGDKLPQNSFLSELNSLVMALRLMITGIHSGADQVKQSSQNIRNSSGAVAEAAAKQVSVTQEMAASMEEFTVSISQISENATETEKFADESVNAAKQGETQINMAVGGMSILSNTIDNAVDRINVLSAQSQEVGTISATIKKIAEQTNLLALNAAIEAARAGESGRGFAVVADEVRKLAERTTQATSEIDHTLQTIMRESEGAVGAMEEATKRAGTSVDEVTKSADVLKLIARESAQAGTLISDVANAAREQHVASTTLARQVENIAVAAEETSADMVKTVAAANELEQVADSLYKAVRKFHF